MRYLLILLLHSAVAFGEPSYHNCRPDAVVIRDDQHILKGAQPSYGSRGLMRRSAGKNKKLSSFRGLSTSEPGGDQSIWTGSPRTQDRTASRQRPSNVPSLISSISIPKVHTFNIEAGQKRSSSKPVPGHTPDRVWPVSIRQLQAGCRRATDEACKFLKKVADTVVETASKVGPPPGTGL